MMAIDELSPEALGAARLLRTPNVHRGGARRINPFDQWGVELGKEMANALLPALEGGSAPENLDPSTAFWLRQLRT